MKDILIELSKIAVSIVLIMGVFFGIMGLVALMVKGIEILPQYIGGFLTFLLYVAFYAMLIAILFHFKRS